MNSTSALHNPSLAARRRPECVAPAGNEEMMRAAVENGADGVYFGLRDFNARLRAGNFDVADLPHVMAWLHERGVNGYVTLNTLVFCGEMEDAARLLRACAEAGVDGVMIQDLGLVALANRLAPDLPAHASTQMTLTAPESIAGIEALGLRIERVVAARELTVKELGLLRAGTDKEIEVFVHGALCVAYSGQCLTSEALGGRSANRGVCAQACRLPFEMIVDGEQRDLGDVKYLLSPKDLAAYEDVGRLIDAGVSSLKIEGRLKSPQYVVATVRAYREAIEQAVAADDESGSERPRMSVETRRALEQTFSRGFTGGYVHEINHQAVVEGRFPKKRGIYLGRVERLVRRGAVVRLAGPVKPGDGVVFDAGEPEGDEEGGRVYGLFRGAERLESFDPILETQGRNEVLLTFGERDLDLNNLHVGDRVWKTSDPRMEGELRATYEGDAPRFRRPVTLTVSGAAGRPLRLRLVDADGVAAEVVDDEPASAARNRPLTPEILEQQLGRMGGTPLALGGLIVQIDDPIMVPFSRLNELRRRGVEALLEARRRRGRDRLCQAGALETLRRDLAADTESVDDEQPASPRLSVLCRTLEQVEAGAAHAAVSTIYTDFENPRLHKEARGLIPADGPRFAPATLRVMKPGETALVRKLLDAEPDAILVRHLAGFDALRRARPDLELIADYSLNVANDLTACLLRRAGFRVMTPSYDLNIDQLLELLAAAPAHWFEVTVHQYMPMFHMEHCVFCRFLSAGAGPWDCGRPCETHTLALRDRVGHEHPVKADAGCRNTVFNAVAQSASEYLGALREAGVRRFRIDFLDENADAVRESIDAYWPALRGETSGSALWRRLHAMSKLGVTRGSLDHE